MKAGFIRLMLLIVGVMLLYGCETNWAGRSSERWLGVKTHQRALPNPGPKTVETGKRYQGEFYEFDRENYRGQKSRNRRDRQYLKESGDPSIGVEGQVRSQSKAIRWPRVDRNDNVAKLASREGKGGEELNKAMDEYRDKLGGNDPK